MNKSQNGNKNLNKEPQLLPTFELEKIFKTMAEINLVGDIVPHAWFQHILLDNGKADTHAILILSKIVYWYRPRLEIHERTGQLLGYRKRFKADKLQYSIGNFAKKLGISDRQVSEALQRLDAQGIITREYRTIMTSDFIKMPNILFIVVNPEAIRRISVLNLNVLHNEQEESTEFLEENFSMWQDDGAKIAPRENTGLKVLSEPKPTVVQKSHYGSENIAPRSCNNRRTYTKNTTKITSQITAAAKTSQGSVSSIDNYVAAAAHFNQDATPAAVHYSSKAEFEDSYIAERLNDHQKAIMMSSLQSLPNVENQLSTLSQEVEAGLLDPDCFKMCEKNFPRKLRAIINSIKKDEWTAPTSLFQATLTATEKEKHKAQKTFYDLKNQYEKHWGDYQHWTRFLASSNTQQSLSASQETLWLKEQYKSWECLVALHYQIKASNFRIQLPQLPPKPLLAGAHHVD